MGRRGAVHDDDRRFHDHHHDDANAPLPPCTVHPKPDDHDVFEVVFGRTETFAAAQVLMARTHDAGFQTGIEVDSCTEYEVAIARDLSHAEALVLLADAQRAGFSQAELERS